MEIVVLARGVALVFSKRKYPVVRAPRLTFIAVWDCYMQHVMSELLGISWRQ